MRQQEAWTKLTIHMTDKAVWSVDGAKIYHPELGRENAAHVHASVCLAMHGNKALCLLTAPKSNSIF